MKAANYKGQEITFSEHSGRFFVGGISGNGFASIVTAKKVIDKAIPDTPFKHFKVVTLDDSEMPQVEGITGSKFVKARRRWEDDRIAFLSGTYEFSSYQKFYGVEDIPMLRELAKQEQTIRKEIEALEKKIGNLDAEREKMEIRIDVVSLQEGNEEPTKQL